LVDIELLLAASFSTIFSKLNPDLHPSTINSLKSFNGDIYIETQNDTEYFNDFLFFFVFKLFFFAKLVRKTPN
jgi:hypothetical protein